MKPFRMSSGFLFGCVFIFCLLSLWANICTTQGSIATAVQFGLSLCVVYLAFGKFSEKLTVDGEPYLLMLVCLLSHLVLFCIAQSILGQQSQPIDSTVALGSLQAGGISYGHQLRCTYWVNYEILLSVLGCIFSKSVYTGQILNALSCSLAIYPIFKLSVTAGGRNVARFVCLMVIFSPVLGLYSTALVGDYLSSMLMVYALYYFCKCVYGLFSGDRFVRDAIFVGILLSLSDAFKNITYLFVGAMIVVLILGCASKMKIRYVLLSIAAFSIVLMSSRMTGVVINDVKYCVIEKENCPSDFMCSVLYELVLGLNLERQGAYNRPLAKKLLAQNARDGYLEILKGAIKSDYKSYPELMLVKFRRLYGTHTGVGSFSSWFALSTCENAWKKTTDVRCPKWVAPFVDSGYLFFSTMMFLGALGLLFIGKGDWLKLCPGIASTVVVLGFVAMSMLIEGHGRYKCAVYPFFFLIVPYIEGLKMPLTKIWSSMYAATVSKLARRIRKVRDEG